MAVVANKSDSSPTMVKVSADEGRTYAESKGFLFFETSAKDNAGVDAPFVALSEAYRQSYMEELIVMANAVGV